jgi:xanthine dehydrogenase YagR molybdenum-binding subunit
MSVSRFNRLDGVEKVTGEAIFSAEYPVASLAHGALVFSTIARGAITDIETGDAEHAPGVIAVITHRNAPAMAVPKSFDAQSEPASGTTQVKILNTDRVTWNGQPIAVVVAESEEQARHAASLVRVRYAEEPAIVTFEEAIPRATHPKTSSGNRLSSPRAILTPRWRRPVTKWT